MSDDIVTRLREKYAGQLPICSEAADEIERLRAKLKQWKALCDTYYATLAIEPDNTYYFITAYKYLVGW